MAPKKEQKLRSTIDIPKPGQQAKPANEASKVVLNENSDNEPSLELSEPNSQSEQESIVKSEESIPLTKENLSESIQQYVEENKAIDIMAKNSLKSDFEFEGNQITYKLANPLEKIRLNWRRVPY